MIPVPKPRVAFAQIGVAAPTCCARPASCTCCCRSKPRSASRRSPAIYLIAHRRRRRQQCPRRHRRVRGRAAAADAVACRRTGCWARWSPIAPFTISRPSPSRWRCWARTSCGRIARPPCAWCSSARTFLIAVTPQAIAIAVFLAGAVLLFSGATPGLGNRLDAAAQFRAAARARAVASARQRRGRGPADHRAWPVPAPRRGVVAHDLAAVRRNPAVAAQGLRLRGSHDSGRRGHRAGLGARPFSAPRFVDRAALFRRRGSSRCSWCW